MFPPSNVYLSSKGLYSTWQFTNIRSIHHIVISECPMGSSWNVKTRSLQNKYDRQQVTEASVWKWISLPNK
jgi:hypothetical protein